MKACLEIKLCMARRVLVDSTTVKVDVNVACVAQALYNK